MDGGAASVVPYRGRHAREDATAWLGMVLFLGSWTMLFGALFAVYAALRLRAPSWPPPDLPRLPLALPAANTLALLAVSAAIQSSLRAARRARLLAIFPAAIAALSFGALFLAGQGVLWVRVFQSGLRAASGPFGSLFWTLTTFHALHVVAGLAGLVWIALRAHRRKYGPASHVGLQLWAAYWHFVGAVWLLIFAGLFVF
jgi:cytochrome c oxidase subunit III